MTKKKQTKWVLFLGQLPAAPSSARVALWRRMRASGATSVLNGAWVLPASGEHLGLFQQMAVTVRGQGGHAVVFTGRPEGEEDDAIVQRFCADRAREYVEFDDRSSAFFAEIEKETKREKFTFAELEEIEDDFTKLSVWLAKIVARDFFPNEKREGGQDTLRRCEAARDTFAEAVYAREGVHPEECDERSDPTLRGKEA